MEPFIVEGDKGTAVRFAQSLLNRFGYKLVVDGVFGPATLAAVRNFQSREHLGIDGKVGPLTWAKLLAGKPAPHPPASHPQTAAERLIAIELHEVGVKEEPAGSNAGPRVSQYEAVCGINHEPWCACFQTWALKELGYKGKFPLNPAYVPSWVAWARQYGLTVKESRPGDLVTFDWAHDGVGNHIGLVQAWPSTIEGNTSEGNNSNGGEVMRRLRNRADVLVFIRLDL